MKKVKIGLLVTLCILTVFLCGIFAYGMTGHNIYWRFWGRNYEMEYAGMHLVLEEEVPLDEIDSIFISYSMNSNDIYLYEGEGNTLTIKEYSEAALNENELSTVSVNGSRLEIRGKRRSRIISSGFFHFGYNGGYTEVWLPASYKGQLALTTSSGDITSEMDLVLEKDLKAAATSGGITMPDVTAGNISLECTSGDITVKQLTGETNIGCSSGYVNAETITGNAQITTTSGDITVQRIDGDAKVKSSSGCTRIMEGSGERSISASSGNITIDGADGLWQVHTTSGNIWIKGKNNNGAIETTSGDISLEVAELNGILDIHATSGHVNMKLLQDSSFAFSADTTSGNIDTFFDDDLNFSRRENSAQGTHGQNPQANSIQIGTTSGDIRITRY